MNREERQAQREERREQKNQPYIGNYEYKFGNSGRIVKKPTDADSSFVSVRENGLIKNLPGTDDFSYAVNDGRRYIYNINNDVLKDFKISDNPNKERRNSEREAKGKKRVGDMFTITDDKVADEVFRLVGGNSNAEFGKIGHTVGNNTKKQNRIWTNKGSSSISTGAIGKLGQEKDTVIRDITHSHPFRFNETTSTKYPSDRDIKFYNSTANNPMGKEIKHNIYAPWTPNKEKLPHTMGYTNRGLDGAEYDLPIINTAINNTKKEEYQTEWENQYLKERKNR